VNEAYRILIRKLCLPERRQEHGLSINLPQKTKLRDPDNANLLQKENRNSDGVFHYTGMNGSRKIVN
jgi:hypothetical protein